LKDAKTKGFRKTLDGLKIEKTALLVEGAENKNLELSSRNLKGVELIRGHQVHPFHLLRYDVAVFAQPVLEKLQATLAGSASKRAAEVAS